jgi:hypothetical protein
VHSELAFKNSLHKLDAIVAVLELFVEERARLASRET